MSDIPTLSREFLDRLDDSFHSPQLVAAEALAPITEDLGGIRANLDDLEDDVRILGNRMEDLMRKLEDAVTYLEQAIASDRTRRADR